MADRINKAELARRLEVKPPYISKLIKQNKLKFDDDGLIEYDQALQQIRNSSERMTNKVEGEETDQDTYKYWKTESEKWKAKQEELDYQEKLKNLIPKDKVEQDAFLIASLVKEQFLTMPESLCNIFAAETDPMVIREQWLKETKRILTELADKLEGLNK